MVVMTQSGRVGASGEDTRNVAEIKDETTRDAVRASTTRAAQRARYARRRDARIDVFLGVGARRRMRRKREHGRAALKRARRRRVECVGRLLSRARSEERRVGKGVERGECRGVKRTRGGL